MRPLRAVWVCLLLLLAGTVSAAAHPLGNFTINHLAKITARDGGLRVRYVLDIAEIPAFQIMQSRGGAWSARTLQSWANDEIAPVRDNLAVTSDGRRVALIASPPHASLRPGAGGLPILRWVDDFSAPLSAGKHALAVQDRVYADRRIGWKDLIAGSQTEPTDELQRYPSALIGTPRRVNSLAFTVDGNAISHIVAVNDETPLIASAASWLQPAMLSNMFARPSQTPAFVLLTILLAFALGALHAVEPGHGKALLAFTLVGSRATAKQALILALSLTFAHTLGVFLLGLALFSVSGFVSESIYPWITLISGVVIAFIGARSLVRFFRRHDHDHEHGTHSHNHAIAGTQPLHFGNAVWAAMSGGIAPCPAAIVVLLAALRLHHLGYGMLLIVVFSMGLATVLSALGLSVVHGAAWLSRRSSYTRIAPFSPLITASVISVLGSVMLAQGLHQEGAGAPVPLLAALILGAIAAVAFAQHTRPHSHTHSHVHTLSLEQLP
ncbi:MAG: nickel/cobalt transporter [Candidatus Baltobacteraceae bacterium]